MRSKRYVVAGAVVGLAAAVGGTAWATIPDSGGAYTACMLKNVGSVRLIDPSLGNKMLGRCSAAETQITWNQKGEPGAAGPSGLPGANGASVTNTAEPTGSSNCAGR